MPNKSETQATIKRVNRLARVLDTRFRVPGTPIRFGLDPIISLLPVAGDSVALAIGLYMVREGVRHGVGTRVIARMITNLLIDWVLGLVPLIGFVPDVWFKANQRNARLLREGLRKKIALPDEV